MEAEDRQDWNVFKQIFKDHWDGFKAKNPRYEVPYYNEIVAKMLNCGNPEKMGYIEYRCTSCGEGKRLISMSCKSTLCLRCGKVYVDNWVSQVSKMLHEGLIYRHIVLTVPEILRETFYNHGQELLGPLFRSGVECLDDFFSCVSRKSLRGGYIVVLQTHGRSGQYNVHLHIMATSGGLDQQTQQWVHLGYLPYKILHKKWQWYLLEMVKKELDTEAIEAIVDYCYKKYTNGFVANVQKGDVPNRYESLAKYLAKYVVSPPISVRRIDSYNGEEVTYHYRSHTTKKVEKETVNVSTFMGRMIQHILPKGFQRIRYYGVQATKTFKKIKEIIKKSISKVKQVVKDAIKIISKKSYRERYLASTGKDPMICPKCGEEMEIWKIWHPKYGVIYDELEQIKKGKYEQQEAIRIQGGNRRSIRSSARGVQIPLFGMRNGTYD